MPKALVRVGGEPLLKRDVEKERLLFTLRSDMSHPEIARIGLGDVDDKRLAKAIGHRFDDIAPCHTIARVSCPVLIAHGCDDAVVPVAEAEQIHASRGAARAQLLLMPGSHDEYADLERNLGAVVGFLDEAMGVR